MNSDWYPKVTNHNRYIDRPAFDYAYYVNITCSAEGKASEGNPTGGRLLLVSIDFLCLYVIQCVTLKMNYYCAL